MAFDASQFVGKQQTKTPLTSFKYGKLPAFGMPVANPLSDLLKEAESFYGPQKDWTPEIKNKLYETYQQRTSPSAKIESSLTEPLAGILEQSRWAQSKEGMEWQLQKANETSRQKAKQALMWQTLANLPETMAIATSPYGGPVGAAMAYQGVAAIPGIYSSTLASYPQLQIPGSSVQQYRYF